MNPEQRAAIAGQTRTITADVHFDPESRSDTGTLSGHAAVFNSVSEDLGFRETLAPGCFHSALARSKGQMLLWQHDPTQILAARDAGTLELSEDATGLKFRAKPVNTSLGRDVAELARTGHVRKMSFAFTVAPGGDKWSKRNGEDHREVHEVHDLVEISLVSKPAYSSTSVTADRAARELAEVRAKRGRISIRDSNPYSYGTHSWFRDIALVDLAEARKSDAITAAIENGGAPMRASEPMPLAPDLDTDPEKAAARLREMRAVDLTTTMGAGGEGAPQGMPPQLMEAFVTAARAQSVLPAALGYEGMPRGTGMKLRIPAFVAGATTSVQSADGAAVSHGTPTTAYSESQPALISGFVLASQQLMDLSGPVDLDMFLAAELGRALGKELDTQLLSGSGIENQTTGILKASGTTALTWTQASPTPQIFMTAAVSKVWAEVFAALGRLPTHVLLAPRRHAWLFGLYDTGNKRTTDSHVLNQFGTELVVPNMPTNTNATQDPVIVLNKESVKLYMDDPVIRAQPQATAEHLEIRFIARQWTGMIVREPKGVGIVTGSGLTTPTFA